MDKDNSQKIIESLQKLTNENEKRLYLADTSLFSLIIDSKHFPHYSRIFLSYSKWTKLVHEEHYVILDNNLSPFQMNLYEYPEVLNDKIFSIENGYILYLSNSHINIPIESLLIVDDTVWKKSGLSINDFIIQPTYKKSNSYVVYKKIDFSKEGLFTILYKQKKGETNG